MRRPASFQRRYPQVEVVVADDPVEQLIARARRQRDRGDDRRGLQFLRQACGLDEWRPRTFALLGAWLLEKGAFDEARTRLRHARWLLVRSGEQARAEALDSLLQAAESQAA
jgi:Flp pilus assembly protein TadD